MPGSLVSARRARVASAALVASLALASSSASCGRSESGARKEPAKLGSAPPPNTDAYGLSAAQAAKVVVRVGEERITLGAFARLLGPPPLKRRRPPEPERRSAFVDELVRTELLFVEARRRGFASGPEARRVRRQAMVERLLEDVHAEARAREEDITYEELRAYHAEHADAFTRPAQVRAAHILVATRADARKIASQIEASPEPGAELSRLALRHSQDELTRDRGGDLGWFAAEADPAPEAPAESEAPDTVAQASLRAPEVPDAVRTQAFAARAAGEVSVVQSPAGFHVVRYLGRRAASTTPLIQVARILRTRIAEERREAATAALTEQVGKSAGLELHPERLSRVRWPR